jgi:hypothetical protein
MSALVHVYTLIVYLRGQWQGPVVHQYKIKKKQIAIIYNSHLAFLCLDS